MKIYLTDQKDRFEQHLNFLKPKALMRYDKEQLKEKVSTIDIHTTRKLDELNLEFLFDYHIFPKNILSFKTQWAVEKRKMKEGDTIVQQVYFPPSKTFSQKLIFGVRICEVIDQSDRKGFSYETLEGHVEQGISIFSLERINDHIVFKIQTFSTPGNLLTKILGPIFSVPYQSFCTTQALLNVKRQLENQ
jgi:hypothetical protein